ncbi:hypothetical protein Tco_0169207 [Tanacetum coccineum]
MKIEESLNVTFDETPPPSKTSPLVDDDLDEEESIKVTEMKNLENDIKDETLEIDEIVNIKECRNHLLENVIGNLNQRTLRLESVIIILAYACALDFKLFQMDVRSAFLNGFINEEICLFSNTTLLLPCCSKCVGTSVDGPYCRGCALLRKEFEEDLLTYCVENGIFQDSQDTFESSDDNTNVINALQEPIVVNQDPGVKSSQGPPLINQNCCYECGDSLDGIFCQQCICKFCGKGAHYGYNCPPKVSIISNPEQCNQTINELPQILPSVHPTCNYEDENSFIYDSKPHSFNVSPSVLTYPPQLQFETYLCELCGNNAHYGYDCAPQF